MISYLLFFSKWSRRFIVLESDRASLQHTLQDTTFCPCQISYIQTTKALLFLGTGSSGTWFFLSKHMCSNGAFKMSRSSDSVIKIMPWSSFTITLIETIEENLYQWMFFSRLIIQIVISHSPNMKWQLICVCSWAYFCMGTNLSVRPLP